MPPTPIINREKYCEVYSICETPVCLHYYEHRDEDSDRPASLPVAHVPHGNARNTVGISNGADGKYPRTWDYFPERHALRVGEGEFGPISPEMMAYQVSGVRVIESWLGYRVKDRKERNSGPSDDMGSESWPPEFTEELLVLLWMIGHTLAMHATLADLLAKICAGPLLLAAELPTVLVALRKPPKAKSEGGLFSGETGDEGDTEE